MPRKRVGVSLRKPSPAPETVPPSAPVVNEVAGEIVGGDASGDGAASTVVRSAASTERPSDIVALREAAAPPAPAQTKAIEAFVSGAAAAFERAASELPPGRLADALKRGIEGYRELVVYLPEKLARELSLHCLEHDIDMSRLVASAVEQYLKGTASAGATRGAAATAQQGLLSMATRALMGELAAWVRTVWARRRAASGAASAAAVG